MPQRAAFLGCFAQPPARDARWLRVCVTYSGICWRPGYVCLCCWRCVPACSCVWALWQTTVADDGEKICSKVGACGSTLGCELCTRCWCQACLQVPAQGSVQSMRFESLLLSYAGGMCMGATHACGVFPPWPPTALRNTERVCGCVKSWPLGVQNTGVYLNRRSPVPPAAQASHSGSPCRLGAAGLR